MSNSLQKVPTGPFHPGYGCAILAIMFLTISGMITWGVYSFMRQDKEFSTFTIENAPELPPVQPSAEEMAALNAKLAEFSAATKANKAADLTLSIADLNDLLILAKSNGIGGQDGSVNYIEMFRFKKFVPESHSLVAELRNPVKNLPWKDGPKRYIVGEATFQPVVENNTFELTLISIVVPGKQVSEGFVNGYRMTPWLSVARLKPDVAAALSKVKAFDMPADGKSLVLHAIPAKDQ